MKSEIVNAMTVDVEDYFQVSAFEKYIPRERWDDIPHRVEGNVKRILDLFDKYDVKATFFILGWLAERHPEMVASIVARGHEIGSHGYNHTRVNEQDAAEFRADICKSKSILENICDSEVIGYRAATFSINNNYHWAHAELARAGFKYSSSIYPIKHDLYGIPNSPRFAYSLEKDLFLEIPISTYQVLNYRVPCGGGGYFRLFPLQVSEFMINSINRNEHKPCVFYFHPWEIDTNQPRLDGLDLKTRFRHYNNIDKMEIKLECILKNFNWGRIDSIFCSGKIAA